MVANGHLYVVGWDFEEKSCQTRTEPSRLFIKYHFKTVIRQRRIGGG